MSYDCSRLIPCYGHESFNRDHILMGEAFCIITSNYPKGWNQKQHGSS